MGKERPVSNSPEPWPGDSTPGWDSADEASWESFPASDPPAVGSVFELEPSPAVEGEPDAPEPDEDEPDEQRSDEADPDA